MLWTDENEEFARVHHARMRQVRRDARRRREMRDAWASMLALLAIAVGMVLLSAVLER